MRMNSVNLFNNKQVVVASGNKLDPYDGSLLTNLKFIQLTDVGTPSGNKVLVTNNNGDAINYLDVNFSATKEIIISNSDSDEVIWGTNNSCTIQHNMNGRVFTQVYDEDGYVMPLTSQYIDENTISFTFTEKPEQGKHFVLICMLGGISLNDSGQINGITLGPCKSLGFYLEENRIDISWVDPDDVVLNDTTLALWNKTVLVKKQGSYPANHLDGTVIATTSRDAANKNYYRDHLYVDTDLEHGKDYFYMLFSQTTDGFWNDLDANKYSDGTGLNWYEVQQFVRAGRGAELFPVGTTFIVDHSEYTTSTGVSGIAFTVLGHDQVPAADETLQHTMCLGMSEVLFTAQFDAGESMYAITADEYAVSGKTYYTYANSAYTALTEGTDWTAGDAVPLSSWYEKNWDNTGNGKNKIEESNLLQWANSSNSANHWFTKQNLWDVCGTVLLNKNGFMKNLDNDFANVVKEAKLITARANVYGGGSFTFNAKFWPLSQKQVNNTNNNGIAENEQLQYYADGNSPIKYLGSTASTWWLRSPSVSIAGFVYFVAAAGSVTFNNAFSTYGVSLACIIA